MATEVKDKKYADEELLKYYVKKIATKCGETYSKKEDTIKNITFKVENDSTYMTLKYDDEVGTEVDIDMTDLLGADSIQVEELPEGNDDLLGVIFQYIGATTEDYKNGYFYKCSKVGEEYVWKAIPVMDMVDSKGNPLVTRQELDNHIENDSRHVSTSERTKWNNKVDIDDVPVNVSDLTDDVGLDKLHEHDNKDVLDLITQDDVDNFHKHENQTDILDKLSAIDGKLAFDGTLVDGTDIAISEVEGNTIVLKDDGLYSPTVDLSNYATKDGVITSSDTRTETAIDNAITNSHSHTNKDNVLDKLDVSNGKLTLDGKYVCTIPISPDDNNIITLKANGLYAPEANNKTQLDKIGENDKGQPTYDGKVIANDWDSLSGKPFSKIDTDTFTIDNETLKGFSGSWNDLDDRLFTSIDADTLSIDDGVLTVIGGGGGTTGDVKWSSVKEKPFDTVDTTTLSVNGGVLSVKNGGGGTGGSSDWDDVTNKPFSTVGAGLSTDSDELSIDYDTLDTKYGSKDNEHTHDNKDNVLDKLDVDDDGNLLFNNAKVNNFALSKADKQSIIEKTDGIYLSLDGYYTKEDLKDVVKDSHSHENQENILDKLGSNDYGLTFDGALVASSVPLDPAADNIITNTSDGLYATLKDYMTKEDIEDTYTTTEDLEDNYIPYDGYVDETSKKLLGSMIEPQTISHSDLSDIGDKTHNELELLLTQHIGNAIIHNSDTLNAVTITGSGFSDGTRSNCIINDNNDLSLLVTDDTTDKTEYTTQKATFISKIYDSGADDAPWVTASWFGDYSLPHSNIVLYFRVGTTQVYSSSTWSDWILVPDEKTITGNNGRYIQAKLEFTTDDKYRDIVFKNIQLFFGINLSSEVLDAKYRTLDNTTYPSLLARLDAMDNDFKNPTDAEVDTAIAEVVADIDTYFA